MGYRVEAERIFHGCGSLVWSLCYSLGSRGWGELVLRARVPAPDGAGVIRLILLGASSQSWGLLEAAACPGLLLPAGMRQLPREAGGDGLACNLDGLTASGTPMYNTRARWSLFILL